MTSDDDELDENERTFTATYRGYAPADRSPSSELIGGHVVNWRTLPDQAARAEWVHLRRFVEWVTVRYNVPVSVVPTCWWQHPALVEELSALHSAHLASFDSTDGGLGPITWHERFSYALPRLTRAYGGGCSNGHKTTKPRSWSNTTDEDEWDAWTNRSHAT